MRRPIETQVFYPLWNPNKPENARSQPTTPQNENRLQNFSPSFPQSQ